MITVVVFICSAFTLEKASVNYLLSGPFLLLTVLPAAVKSSDIGLTFFSKKKKSNSELDLHQHAS